MKHKKLSDAPNSYAFYEVIADENFHIYLKKDDALASDTSFHRSIEFTYLLQGEVKANIDGTEYLMSPGDMVFIDSYQSHTYEPLSKNILAYVIVISEHYLSDFNLENQDKTLPHYLNDKEKNLILKKIIENWLNEPKRTMLFNFGYVNLLLANVIELYGLIEKDKRENDLIFQLLTYINSNFQNPINLNSIAKHFGYSPEYISRIFKTTLQIGIRDYLTNLRVNMAKKLMKKNNLAMLEICYMSVCSSPATFYRALKLPSQNDIYE